MADSFIPDTAQEDSFVPDSFVPDAPQAGIAGAAQSLSDLMSGPLSGAVKAGLGALRWAITPFQAIEEPLKQAAPAMEKADLFAPTVPKGGAGPLAAAADAVRTTLVGPAAPLQALTRPGGPLSPTVAAEVFPKTPLDMAFTAYAALTGPVGVLAGNVMMPDLAKLVGTGAGMRAAGAFGAEEAVAGAIAREAVLSGPKAAELLNEKLIIERTIQEQSKSLEDFIRRQGTGVQARDLQVIELTKATIRSMEMRRQGLAEQLGKIGEAALGVAPPPVNPQMFAPPKQLFAAALQRGASEASLGGIRQMTAGQVTKDIVDEIILKMNRGEPMAFDEMMQVSENVAKMVGDGSFAPETAARLLGLDMTSKEGRLAMADLIMGLKSQQGLALYQWRRLSDELVKIWGKDPELLAKLKAGQIAMTPWEQFVEAYRRVDNIRRAAMVSQPSTSFRNIVSQTARYAIHILDDAMAGVMGAATGKIPAGQALDLAFQDVHSFIQAMKPGQMQTALDVLARFPKEATRMIGTPVAEVTADGRIAKFLNTLNTIQEQFFRRAAFDAHLRQSLALRGLNLEEHALLATKQEVTAAVQHALNLTFAEAPTSGPGRAILNLYREFPFLTALGQPFPRFWLNAMKFLHEFSPSPVNAYKAYRDMAAPDPRVAFRALDRAFIGSLMIAGGAAIDRMGTGGEKWFEFNAGGKKYIDLRPYNPFTAHLFVGRMISRYFKEGGDAFLRLSPEDWSQALLSLRRTDATGSPLLDIVFSKSDHEFKNNMVRMVSNYVSSFFTPGRAVMDLLGQFIRDERVQRTSYEVPAFRQYLGKTASSMAEPVVGAILSDIPFAERYLPERPSAFRSKPEERENPLLRQASGIAYRVKTPVEEEADRLRIKPRDIYPQSGQRELDRLIVERMGPILERTLQELIASPAYQQSDREMQRALFTDQINRARNVGRKIALGQRPDLALDDYVKNKPEYLKRALEEAEQKLKP